MHCGHLVSVSADSEEHPYTVATWWMCRIIIVRNTHWDHLVHFSAIYQSFHDASIATASVVATTSLYFTPAIPCPENTIRWTNVGLLLGQRRRRWANIKPTLGSWDSPTDMRYWTIVGLLLVHRLRRWPNLKQLNNSISMSCVCWVQHKNALQSVSICTMKSYDVSLKSKCR